MADEKITDFIKEDKPEPTSDSTISAKDELDDFFEEFLDKDSLFIDKTVLQVRYLPDIIVHRTSQMKQLASILAPCLKNDKPSNLFIYGKTGSGKTLCMKHTMSKLCRIAEERNLPLRAIYLNCKMKKVADTEYRIIAQLAREVGEEVPMTGLPTDEVYNIFLSKLDAKKQTVIIVLDEIDQIVKKSGDEILYTLTRINSELKRAQVGFVGISNDVRFMEDIDPRVKSSLGEEELIFPPYNALELKDILERRSILAFKEESIEGAVLAKCAAYAAREHGDARRALDLLRVAGEVAERDNCEVIESKHIDMAEDKIEKSRILEIIQTQPKQSQIVMHAILLVLEEKKRGEVAETGEVFEHYKEVCKQTGNNILTQRRISDLISELDMLGLINAKLISKGRYGRTREIYITIPADMLERIKLTLQSELF
jgi:archaeal cell division control protein 6